MGKNSTLKKKREINLLTVHKPRISLPRGRILKIKVIDYRRQNMLALFLILCLFLFFAVFTIQLFQDSRPITPSIANPSISPSPTETLPSTPETVYRACEVDDDCLPVECSCKCSGCGGFSYEDVVNKKYAQWWYQSHQCLPNKNCPMVCCPAVFTVCENQLCQVKPKTKENIPPDLILKEEKERKLCLGTGGIWQENPDWVGSCLCNKEGYFREEEGCRSIEDDCAQFVGQLFSIGSACDIIPGELKELRQKCILVGTLPFNACLCPNNELWNSEDRCSP